ncbi:hypothetical protein RE2895_16760 [Rhodococcus erythropolis]|nr:hypothetical protein RE2895_16760 [Rhodococcus erythropolis]
MVPEPIVAPIGAAGEGFAGTNLTPHSPEAIPRSTPETPEPQPTPASPTRTRPRNKHKNVSPDSRKENRG